MQEEILEGKDAGDRMQDARGWLVVLVWDLRIIESLKLVIKES